MDLEPTSETFPDQNELAKMSTDVAVKNPKESKHESHGGFGFMKKEICICIYVYIYGCESKPVLLRAPPSGSRFFWVYFLFFFGIFLVLCAWMLQKLQESQG